MAKSQIVLIVFYNSNSDNKVVTSVNKAKMVKKSSFCKIIQKILHVRVWPNFAKINISKKNHSKKFKIWCQNNLKTPKRRDYTRMVKKCAKIVQTFELFKNRVNESNLSKNAAEPWNWTQQLPQHLDSLIIIPACTVCRLWNCLKFSNTNFWDIFTA